MKHKLEPRLLGEISITSDVQMTPPLAHCDTTNCKFMNKLWTWQRKLRSCLVSRHSLKYGWCHLHIWGYWYFFLQPWFQLVLHPAQHFSCCPILAAVLHWPIPPQETLKHSSVPVSMGFPGPRHTTPAWALWVSLAGMGSDSKGEFTLPNRLIKCEFKLNGSIVWQKQTQHLKQFSSN